MPLNESTVEEAALGWFSDLGYTVDHGLMPLAGTVIQFFRITAADLSEKCEAPMVLRTGDFTPFWGCSRYPRCRGRLNER